METTEKTTIENNKLIAEFMGGFKEGTEFIYFPSEGRHVKINQMIYHSDWNWIMQVVEKIEGLGFEISMHKDGFHIYYGKTNTHTGLLVKNRIEQAYNSVVEFINWYNLNNQKNEK